MTRLQPEIAGFIIRYYRNRSVQTTVRWNKSEDLEAIRKAATKHGWIYEASAGTFWFKKRVKGRKVAWYRIAEKDGRIRRQFKLFKWSAELMGRIEVLHALLG